MKFIIVPVKELTKAKDRLSPLLSPGERRSLAYAMLEDVLIAVSYSRCADRKFVVTKDAEAITLAKSLGIEAIEEGEQRGESVSVDEASRECAQMGATSVLRIPGDVPLITPGDVDLILSRQKPSPSLVLVPSRDGLGTNAMMRTPPNVIRSQFGYDSFRKHTHEATSLKIPFEVLDMPRFALDIDEPDDIVSLMSYYTLNGFNGSRSYRVLRKLGVPERVRKSYKN
jgi:2-phospho-L-lactate guanylyltransferase